MDRDTTIRLADLWSKPVEIEGEQVVAMAESVSETGGTDTGPIEEGMDGVDGMVQRAAQHLRDADVSSWRRLCCPADTCSCPRKGTWDE